MLQLQDQEDVALLESYADGSFESLADKPSHTTRGAKAHSSPARRWPGSLTWVLALLLAVGATDLLSVLYVVRTFRTHYANGGFTDLDMANPYVGLDELYASGIVNASKIDPVLTKARVTATVYSDRPGEMAPIGEHDVFDKYGYLTPREQHFHVDAKTHSIAQFRAIDYGMEDCALVVRLPALDERLESKESFRLTQPSRIEVCALDAPRPLDIRKLSWKTRPRCERKVGSLEAVPGEESVVTRFPCVWGSLHTFEFGCADGADCLVDVWASQNQTWGMWMRQYQTV